MKDSFFLQKRKGRKLNPQKKKQIEEKLSDDDGELDTLNLEHEKVQSSSEDEMEETPAQKRLRLAKEYLSQVKQETDGILEGEIDAQELDRDLIAERLLRDSRALKGMDFRMIADGFSDLNLENCQVLKSKQAHRLSLTSICYSNAGYVYTGSKDSITKWSMNGERLFVFKNGKKKTKRLERSGTFEEVDGHQDQILCLAASFDGKLMVSGSMDKTIRIWSTEDNTQIGKFTQHRDAVTGLAFRLGHNDLYSCSYDRTVKVWNAQEQSYIETLFGHQDKITAIDALSRERAVTCGSRDRTCRLWKVVEESQLVFKVGTGGLAITEDLVVLEELSKTGQKREKDNGLSGGSVDAIAMIDEEHFVCGTDSGAISLWSTQKKKPLYTRLNCHGLGSKVVINGDQSSVSKIESTSLDTVPSWITALAAVPYTDMFASGSGDGYIRLWKLSESKKSFNLLNSIPITGFCNSLTFFTAADPSTKDKKKQFLYLGVAVGQEHRLGRWWRIKEARNEARIFQLGAAIN